MLSAPLPWCSANAKTLTLLRAYTRQPDGTELAVPDGDIQRGTMPGQNGFESSSYLTVAFPAVRTGSTVVLEYRRQTPRIAPFEALSQMQSLSRRQPAHRRVRLENSRRPATALGLGAIWLAVSR